MRMFFNLKIIFVTDCNWISFCAPLLLHAENLDKKDQLFFFPAWHSPILFESSNLTYLCVDNAQVVKDEVFSGQLPHPIWLPDRRRARLPRVRIWRGFNRWSPGDDASSFVQKSLHPTGDRSWVPAPVGRLPYRDEMTSILIVIYFVLLSYWGIDQNEALRRCESCHLCSKCVL